MEVTSRYIYNSGTVVTLEVIDLLLIGTTNEEVLDVLTRRRW